MKEMFLDGYIAKMSVVYNLNFLQSTYSNGIIPVSIGITSSNEALSHAQVHVSTPFLHEGGQGLTFRVDSN